MIKHSLSLHFLFTLLYTSGILAVSSHMFPIKIKKMIIALNKISLNVLEKPFIHINEIMIINLWSGITIIQTITLIISFLIIILGNLNFFNINPYKGGVLLNVIIIICFYKAIIINILFLCTNIQILNLEFNTYLPPSFKIGNTKLDEIIQTLTIMENSLIYLFIYFDLKLSK